MLRTFPTFSSPEMLKMLMISASNSTLVVLAQINMAALLRWIFSPSISNSALGGFHCLHLIECQMWAILLSKSHPKSSPYQQESLTIWRTLTYAFIKRFSVSPVLYLLLMFHDRNQQAHALCRALITCQHIPISTVTLKTSPHIFTTWVFFLQ